MVYPHKWSLISCKSSAGQGKFAGERPAFYHCRASNYQSLVFYQSSLCRYCLLIVIIRPSELAHDDSNELTWSAAVSLSFSTTPSAVMLCTWQIPMHGSGTIAVLLRAPRLVKIISFDLLQTFVANVLSLLSSSCSVIILHYSCHYSSLFLSLFFILSLVMAVSIFFIMLLSDWFIEMLSLVLMVGQTSVHVCGCVCSARDCGAERLIKLLVIEEMASHKLPPVADVDLHCLRDIFIVKTPRTLGSDSLSSVCQARLCRSLLHDIFTVCLWSHALLSRAAD